jgi:hypothetical protein
MRTPKERRRKGGGKREGRRKKKKKKEQKNKPFLSTARCYRKRGTKRNGAALNQKSSFFWLGLISEKLEENGGAASGF